MREGMRGEARKGLLKHTHADRDELGTKQYKIKKEKAKLTEVKLTTQKQD